ncbi:tryptophan synthase beta subunit-like PLP-dependent enzyme [Apiosordaria backusii]|uniref:Tryptophan synthase beta subunit-like PLP-dependent enzyme n=1 Tax=Apiosordaria backusii TaxID=314023 RepID=A0AA40EZM3_9PEZI|nr:tryptophan synthase beta subunit-like PLP-dependent enzyme [Apiosordaria backusii]
MSPAIHLNPAASTWRYSPPTGNPFTAEFQIQTFHSLLPSYSPTPLYPLPSLAEALNVKSVYLKSEASRLGLPSFKILGASWAVYRAVLDFLDMTLTPDHPLPSLDEIKFLIQQKKLESLKIVTATEGNWGRAVTKMAGYLGLGTVVFVSGHMHPFTRELIENEGLGAEVVVVEGDYDKAAEAAKEFGEEEGMGKERLLVMDMSWEGYEKVPGWVVEGYTTMLAEYGAQISQQTDGGEGATHVFVPCGCGSIARAVTQYFKDSERENHHAQVVAVEPDSAACLQASLQRGEMTTVETGDETIMCGMNCGTLSGSAWGVLEKGVDASVIVTDKEAHQAVTDLEKEGIEAGPCGAATLAGLRRICGDGAARERLGLGKDAVVVLFCTEGRREYEVPV